MGTDIHIYAERFDGHAWHPLSLQVPEDRNYWAFALLAGVRNGEGFAGCDMGDAVTPISAPRGVPHDLHDNNGLWLGDHSFSWLLLSELRAIDLDALITERGMVSEQEAARMDACGGVPIVWCAWTSQPGFVRRTWQRSLREAAWLIPKILACFQGEDKPDTIRIVFGFDN